MGSIIDDDVSVFLSQDLLLPLFKASRSSNLEEALEILLKTARIDEGRAHLASMNILPVVLHLLQSVPYSPGNQFLISLSLKLLRNLCAGEITNQSLFISEKGTSIVGKILKSARVAASEADYEIMHFGLQALANVSLAGGVHQQSIWASVFPDEFVELAKIHNRITLHPLCMILYVCCDGNPSLVSELVGDDGLPVMVEILKTASVVGFGEDWLKLLLSRICLEEVHFPQLFSRLYNADDSGNNEDINSGSRNLFSSEQAFLLRIVSEILNERLQEITVPVDFAVFIFGIFKKSLEFADSTVSRVKSSLPTGSATIDVLGYSLTLLRDMCAQIQKKPGFDQDPTDVASIVLSRGILDLLLSVLAYLEPPKIIKKAVKQNENEETSLSSYKPCLYRGFRRDIVGVIGNCAFQRKNVQDDIREKNGIMLMLQQCVTDEDNPFLREWGIWSVRNLLEGNPENQQAVAELELQGSADVPELSNLGLRLEVDPKTRCAKLVNIS